MSRLKISHVRCRQVASERRRWVNLGPYLPLCPRQGEAPWGLAPIAPLPVGHMASVFM